MPRKCGLYVPIVLCLLLFLHLVFVRLFDLAVLFRHLSFYCCIKLWFDYIFFKAFLLNSAFKSLKYLISLSLLLNWIKRENHSAWVWSILLSIGWFFNILLWLNIDNDMIGSVLIFLFYKLSFKFLLNFPAFNGPLKFFYYINWARVVIFSLYHI